MSAARNVRQLAMVMLCACSDAEGVADLGPAPEYAVPGCEAFDPAPCDVRAAVCQTRLFELAACLRGDEPGMPPPVSLMTEQQYAEYLNARLAMEPAPPDPNHFERAIVLLDLAVPGAFGLPATVTELVGNLAGVYRFDEQDVVLIDRGVADGIEQASAVLVHEFVHALQDRALGIEAFLDAYASSFDSFLAVNGMIEGEARLHQVRYIVSAYGLNPTEVDFRRHFQRGVELGEEDTLLDQSPYVASFRNFPYAWGARYLHFLWRAGGTAALAERFASPPITSATLMASVEEAAVEDVAPEVVPAPVAPPEWSLVDETVLGAWGTFLILAREASRDRAREAALGWRGDGIWIYANATAFTTLVWRVEFADELAASAAEELLAPRFATGLQRQGARIVLALSELGGALDWGFAP